MYSLYLNFLKLFIFMSSSNINFTAGKNMTEPLLFVITHLFWTIRLMFLRATYWTSGSPESKVTSGGDNFFSKVL